MLSSISTIVLGVVEGITEFLPISSTGHLILASSLLGIAQDNFQKSFEIIIQLGAILAVLVLYWKKLLLNWEIFKRVVVAFIPTGIIGLVVYKLLKHYLLGNVWIVVASLFIGGICLIIFESRHKEHDNAIAAIELLSYRQCIIIGLAQATAIIPGVSRSAATIVGGLALGLKRKTIVEFSFMLAIPTMVAASGLDLIKNINLFSRDQVASLALGFVVSFVTALATVRWLLRYVERHDFKLFGIYRIVVAVIFTLFILTHII